MLEAGEQLAGPVGGDVDEACDAVDEGGEAGWAAARSHRRVEADPDPRDAGLRPRIHRHSRGAEAVPAEATAMCAQSAPGGLDTRHERTNGQGALSAGITLLEA